jgi:hypothetical protein
MTRGEKCVKMVIRIIIIIKISYETNYMIIIRRKDTVLTVVVLLLLLMFVTFLFLTFFLFY